MDSNRPQVESARPQGEEAETEERKSGVIPEIRQAFRQMGPWMTSFLFHIGLVIVALMLMWIVIEEKTEDRITPLHARLTPHQGSLSKSQEVSLTPTQMVREVMTPETALAESIEQLTQRSMTELHSLVGVAGGGGKLAPPGLHTGRGNPGLGIDLFPSGGDAKKIVYLIDASGSLVDAMPLVIKELAHSIQQLSEQQEFNVIFFQAGSAVEVPAPEKGWKRADVRTKEAVIQWISLSAGHVEPRGRTDPTDAVKLAMSYQPELMFLLSDNITGRGRYEINRAELLELFRRAGSGKVTINTIQFLNPDPLNTLGEIAKQHNGIFRVLLADELGLRRELDRG